MFTHGHSRIVGVGVYTPEKCVASSEIMEYLDSENRFGIATDWLEKVMGVRERRVSPDDWLPSDLAVPAATDALDDAELLPKDLDAIIYAGVVRDYIEPATGHVVQEKLGADKVIAFDVSNACMGFMSPFTYGCTNCDRPSQTRIDRYWGAKLYQYYQRLQGSAQIPRSRCIHEFGSWPNPWRCRSGPDNGSQSGSGDRVSGNHG